MIQYYLENVKRLLSAYIHISLIINYYLVTLTQKYLISIGKNNLALGLVIEELYHLAILYYLQ